MLHYQEIKNLDLDNLTTVTDNKKITYYNIEAGFDIETTSYKIGETKSAFMYIWQFGIGYGNPIYYGRTWEEFNDLLNNLILRLDITLENRLVIYVHNLGYEFQFMRKYFQWENIFSISERKPIRATTKDGIEFRDSYILSGYSLAGTARNLAKHTVKKMIGDLDYSLIRTHRTPLTPLEMGYCRNDIEIILAYINEQIEHSKGIDKIPMTNTGRVRTYVRNKCYYINEHGKKGGKGQYFKYRKIMDDLTIEPETYLQLKTAFMGGFTHANASHVGKLLHNVSSIDFTSSYPAVMVSEKFPMTRFKPIDISSWEQFEHLTENFAVVFNARFENLKPRITQENYISESKCRNLKNPVINNGRISSADILETTITEIDFSIMSEAYEWDSLSVSEVKYAVKDYLPKPIISSILELYQDKTELKDVEGFEVEYMLSKGMLNSIYGMCVTDVLKDEAIYEDDLWNTQPASLIDGISDYNNSKNRFLYYAWGIWVTAYARRNLWTGIIAVGDDYVYSDTDSLKILNYEKHTEYVQWFDSQIVEKMTTMCEHYSFNDDLLAPKTKEGVEKLLGIWDFEGTYQNFKTLGAKRYLTDENGKLQLTVAGLSKQNGLQYLKENSDNTEHLFSLFNDDLYIPADKTGKMTHTYIDNPLEFEVVDYLGELAHIETLSGTHLENCEFTLSIADQFKQFLKQLSNGYIYKGVNYQ